MSNLLFFNKAGYPHNFQYNQSTDEWEGKIIFDENSDQTFKTQSLHIFESVAPIDFVIDANLVNMNYNNDSGLTIAGQTGFNNQLITNIEKVNTSSDFYSKWIYGSNFHKNFPVGSVISFSGVTGFTETTSLLDFDDSEYFTVLSVKTNAFLIITNTRNDIFDLTFYSGYVNSLNMISINDYNRNIYNLPLFENLYAGKKISIINSIYNDSIVSVNKSGITYSYLNEIKLNGTTGQIFSLEVKLFTERPKIFQGNVTISGTTMNLGRYSYLLEPEIIYIPGGTSTVNKEIIFEDINGNQLFSGITFEVNSVIDTLHLGTKQITFKKYYQETSYQYTTSLSNSTQWNTIQISGYTDIKPGDIIAINAPSGLTGSTFMHNRDFSISNVSYNSNTNTTILFTPGYIIDEIDSTYDIIKKLSKRQINTVVVTPSGDVSPFNNTLMKNAYCYLTSTILDLSSPYISGTTNSSIESNTIENFINIYKNKLFQYGIDVYHSIKNSYNYLSVESLYGAKYGYFYAAGYTNGVKINDDFSYSISGITEKYNIIINEKLVNEKTNKSDLGLHSNEAASIIVLKLNNDTNRFGFVLTINSIQFSINYDTNSQTTINNFINTFGTVFYSNGFLINSGYSSDYSGYTLNITSDIDIWDLQVTVNILSTYNIIQQERNRSLLLSGNEIITPANLFDLQLSTGMIIQLSGSNYNENNKAYNIIGLTEHSISLSYQGVFISENNVTLTGTTKEFIRKPRGDYDRDIYLRAYWEIPYDDIYWKEQYDNTLDDSIFFYDISGDQLIPYNEALTYIGSTPLIDSTLNNVVNLNPNPNRDITKISNPKYQQTIFNELIFKLEQLDSSVSYNWVPEPLEIFLGYNSPNEGVNTRTLKIELIEKFQNTNTNFSFTGYTNSGSSISTSNFFLSGNTLDFKAPIDFSFISYGFKVGQIINLYFKDQSLRNQRIFEDNHNIFKILNVSRSKITIDTGYTYKYTGFETGYTYNPNGFKYFTTTGSTFFFKIEIEPIEILSCQIYGQTEIEDIRYKVNLNNLGIQTEEDVYQIIYQSDIEDDAIDYTLFNRKRKELLSTSREIFDYIGSYKALVNSINFFGYNDLQLYEYYKNIDQASPLYSKLHRVLIPDIFDNSIPGWNEIDFIAGKYQNQTTWTKTNLFNLTYQITDEDGNNVLIYSLAEVQFKLTKLKKWLRQNIIPISSNLLDITGVANSSFTLYQDYDESNQTKKSVIKRNSTVVNFNYTATLNFENDYLVTVNFYTMSGATGTDLDNNEVPLSFSAKIKTFYLSGSTVLNPTETLIPVQYLKILKNDLTPFSFNINKYLDPYIYIETTTYDNDGCGLGYVNNKLFYYDEPRNYWLVNNNFDLTKMVFWQTTDYIDNTPQKFVSQNIINYSTAVSSSVETIVQVNTLNNTYLSQIPVNNSTS